MPGPPPPEASVIVPTRGRPQALEACLGALGAQAGVRHEVVVVADGPTPGLAGVVEAAREEGLAVRLISQPQAGPASARNTGARVAEGALLAFTDDDCRPAPAWLAALAGALREDARALVGGPVLNGLRANACASAAQLVVQVGYEQLLEHDHPAAYFTSNNLAMTAASFSELGGFDARFRATAEDRDLCDRARRAGHALQPVAGAVVEHRHPLTPLRLWRQQAAYGRGAVVMARRRRASALGPLTADRAFFGLLARRTVRADGARRLVPLVALTQLAYACGALSALVRR